MANRIALVLNLVLLALAGSGCSHVDPSRPEGYDKQAMMRQPPSFSAGGANSNFKTQKKGGGQ